MENMSMKDYSVLVFMSTYNGEKYLEEQIETILNQKDVNVRLLIRDDGSQDNTLNILKEYESQYSNISVLEGKNIGFAASFLTLIYEKDYKKADYYAFSDQDDIWDQDKLISGIELMNGQKKPMFYYSAQRIVDADGIYLRNEKCFKKVQYYSKYSASMVPLTRGCTQLWNDSFHNILLVNRPDIEEIYSHDFWTSLVAFWTASLIYDDFPHMGYRQTKDNVSGTYRNSRDHLNKIYVKALTLAIKTRNIREKTAKQLEYLYGSENKCKLLTAHYRDSIWLKIQLLFSNKYKKGLSLKWKVFNTFLVVSNRL